jgi:hypothetical protein
MSLGDYGNNSVTVKKADLLATMKKNLLKHRQMFLEAQEGYREEVIKHLDSMLKDARDGKNIRTFVSIEAPVDHSDDYETNIVMLEWSVNDTMTITQMQFKNFVLDKWGWSEQFVTTNAVYTAKKGK